MKIFFAAALFLVLSSCSNSSSDKKQLSESIPPPVQVPAIKTVAIPNTGLLIDIPSDMEITIAQDTGYVFANIQPKNKSQQDILEASLYVGPAPNRDAPQQKHTRSESQGSLLGRTVNWVTYSTTNWQHKEVIMDYQTGEKRYLHVWCNGHDADELARAMNVIKSLREEPVN